MTAPVDLMADLLASVLEEWSRYYGSTDEQRSAVQSIVDRVFAIKVEPFQ